MKNIAGFTLIEISVVLVIIGLVVGGIILGQTLIRSSELRSIVTDIEKFETDAVIGENAPASRIEGVGYFIYTPAPLHTSSWALIPNLGIQRNSYDSIYTIGREASNNYLTRGGFLSPVEAKALDDKIDDGLANNGNFRVESGNAIYNTSGCTSGTAPNYSYTSNNTSLCSLTRWFRSQ